MRGDICGERVSCYRSRHGYYVDNIGREIDPRRRRSPFMRSEAYGYAIRRRRALAMRARHVEESQLLFRK